MLFNIGKFFVNFYWITWTVTLMMLAYIIYIPAAKRIKESAVDPEINEMAKMSEWFDIPLAGWCLIAPLCIVLWGALIGLLTGMIL